MKRGCQLNITDVISRRTVENTPSTTEIPTDGCYYNPFPSETPVGMLYVPYQSWQSIYDPQVAIERGTIFEALDKPFIGERSL